MIELMKVNLFGPMVEKYPTANGIVVNQITVIITMTVFCTQKKVTGMIMIVATLRNLFAKNLMKTIKAVSKFNTL